MITVLDTEELKYADVVSYVQPNTFYSQEILRARISSMASSVENRIPRDRVPSSTSRLHFDAIPVHRALSIA